MFYTTSNRQPRPSAITSWLLPLTRGSHSILRLGAGWNATHTTQGRIPSYLLWFYQATSNTLKMGMESVPDVSENIHILTWLSAQQHFIEWQDFSVTFTKASHSTTPLTTSIQLTPWQPTPPWLKIDTVFTNMFRFPKHSTTSVV